MKRAAILGLISGLVMGGNALAFEDYDVDGLFGIQGWQKNWPHTPVEVDPNALAGGGIGALAGALVGGPPGFLVGAAGGVLAGRNATLESERHALRREVIRLQQQLKQSSLEGQRKQARLRAEKTRLLQAVADGIVYNVHFRTESYSLEPYAQSDLRNLARALSRVADIRLRIDAYADRRGSSAFNQDLTQKRAQAVFDLLTAEGMPSGRIRRHIHGEEKARYPEGDLDGLAFDRLVRIHFQLEEDS